MFSTIMSVPENDHILMVKKGKHKKTQEEKNFDEFKKNFNSDEDRIGHSATMIIVFILGIYLMFNPNKFLSLFYDKRASMGKNIFYFCSFLACCWIFGFILSKTIAFGLRFRRNLDLKRMEKKD